ncbi:MAG: hypothetical protein IJ151_06265 [Bacteroidales bacterium]|nr:hypothetical protein [Bacteroidales bacterium]
MNETFNFKRFWTFFRYDLKQTWRRNAKPAIFIGGSGLILFLLWTFFSLVCFFVWTTPPIWARLAGFLVASFILQLYITKTYGFITDKKKGSDYLMIPASATEKFISMLLIVLIVIPFMFATVYYCLDALICLAFPSCGMTLFSATAYGWEQFTSGITAANIAMINEGALFTFSVGGMVMIFVLSSIFGYLFYMLCGMIFKRFKILWALLLNFGMGTILSSLIGLIIGGAVAAGNDVETVANGVGTIFLVLKIYMAVGIVAFAIGIYYRLKRISH